MRTRAACSSTSSCGDLYAATYAHICRQQAATSRVRERRSATHSPSGAANAAPCKTTAGARTRLRANGAATPIATKLHVVVGAVEGAQHAPVLVVAEALRQVLLERPPTGHVYELHPAADPEHGQVAFDRRARQRDLEDVAFGRRHGGLLARRPAVE